MSEGQHIVPFLANSMPEASGEGSPPADLPPDHSKLNGKRRKVSSAPGMGQGSAKRVSDKLADAATQLVKAAQLETERMYLSTTEESLAELKHIHSLTKISGESLAQIGARSDGELKQMKADIASLKESVVEMKSEIVKLRQSQTLQWAIDHTTLQDFTFYAPGSGGKSSGTVVKDCLIAFMLGNGRVYEGYTVEFNLHDLVKRRDSEEAFRVALSNQIKALTGLETRWTEFPGSSKYAIFLK
eukprot:TRINITY_DN16939_c0_g1_i1.p1 TRINITY_DN16939_c0_g1~~TRINITY_DN16939_c0_g1_i1.p1  ORF type:complete len:243 (-),score=49.39 TRINITY_DN16939_c0_g1_i1:667-1395(-)